MYKNKLILALIPARGGSKGVPKKNIKPLCGKPLIAWTIVAAKASKYIDKIIVSTDNNKIAMISKKYGAEIPFMRPKRLSTDSAKGMDVVLHAINWMESRIMVYDLIIVLQPTSPLRTTQDIDKAIKLLLSKKAKAIVSVCETDYHPCWSNILSKDSCMKGFLKSKIVNKNRQELSVFHRLNGAIYLAYCNYLKRYRSFFTKKTYAYVMPKQRSVDIDHKIDFKFAECLIRCQFC